MKTHLQCVLLIGLSSSAVLADDWPCWRGPERNGISKEKGWLDQWPKSGPTIAWKASVGLGFSAVAVAEGRVYTMGHSDGKDTVYCLDAVTGKQVWSHSYEAALGDLNFEGGPTSTPTVHDGRVYTLSRWGDLHCFHAADGKVHWSRNLVKQDNAKLPGWGFSSSPVIHDKLLLLNVGSGGMALEKDTGKVVWTSGDEEAGYSTPVLFQRDGDWCMLVSSGTAFKTVKATTGKLLWEHRWITRYGVNSADPILAGNLVFISSGYNKGCALLETGGEMPKEVWRNKNMRNQLNACVLLDGHLYGIDGDTSTAATLRCVELKSGESRWSFDGVGCGAVMAADGKLIVLSETGELLVGPPSPKAFTPSARARVLEGKCWTVPVLANGRIYCRNAAGEVVCVAVRGK